MNGATGLSCTLVAAMWLAGTLAAAPPVPQPFPRPEGSRSTETLSGPQTPPPTRQAPPTPVPPPATDVPTQATLGVPIYPAATFLASFDAGQGQRYFLFGTPATYAQTVSFYRTALKQRGDVVFEEPPTHIFEIGRFREESMAFPPSVVVKDYTWGGFGGYLDPKPVGQGTRYPTVIQIVPPAPGAKQ